MTGMFNNLRRKLISAPLRDWCNKVLPPMSDTEREALEAGTVWWDAELFTGKPDWDKLRSLPKPAISAEEQAFMDGPLEELCGMLNSWQITEELRDLPPQVWRFIREKGFLGMIIPKEYGGLGFSALGHSSIVMKLATRSLNAGISVMVPNSLGPAELLLHYGTQVQKDYYLPRLAKGLELPCFALTGPDAGSDASSIPDRGIVCYGEHQGKRVLGLKVSWEKRYITLGPVATLLGLAFKAYDPDHLLGETEELGITLALIPTNTPGVEIGRRHFPAKQAFQNGPNSGRDVFVPLTWIIGEQDGIGRGWSMLMDCLAAGRSISLPSLSTGATRFCARVTGAYARVRKQFNVPVGKFEGVQEALARMAGYAYLLDATRQITLAAVDRGEKPSVLSAIVKYHFTERMRISVNDAMDVHGGRGICEGPSNYLANAYQALPVAITVEGANILTRSLIIFGQGSVRCHPYLLQEMHAAQDSDPERGLAAFDQALFAHLGFTLRNLGRSWWLNLTGAKLASKPVPGAMGDYYRQLSRASASFTLLADIALLILGGELKRRERLSARFGDVLSELYMLSCVLKRFEDDGCPQDDLPLVDWNYQQGLYTIQQRFDEILANFPSQPLAWLLRRILFPWGRRFQQPSDRLAHQCAELLLSPSETRERLTAGIFISHDPEDVTGRLEYALEKVLAADSVQDKVKASGLNVKEAVKTGVINELEGKLLQEAEKATHKAIMVDDFDPEELTRHAQSWSGAVAQQG